MRFGAPDSVPARPLRQLRPGITFLLSFTYGIRERIFMLTYGFCGHDPGNFCLTKRRRGAILAAPEYRRKLAIPSMHKQQTKRPSRVPWRAAAIIAPVLLLAACTPPGPSLVGRELGTTPAYIIGPGDVVNVFVYRAPELSVEAPVRPDGKISTPLVPDVPALGKTPTQLA